MERKGTRLLRGQLCLICAAPGVGKSAFILTYALKAEVPTLYFSADSDAFTQLSRSTSILADVSLEHSAFMVRTENFGLVGDKLDQVPIHFDYHASPSLDQIENAILAYDALYEDYPELVVVDNITNVRTGGENDDDPFKGLESLNEYLHDLARTTGACVVGLHHVTGEYNNGDKPIPLGGVKGQIARVPELVLTLHKAPGQLRVSTVKNRAGKADPSGQDFVVPESLRCSAVPLQ